MRTKSVILNVFIHGKDSKNTHFEIYQNDEHICDVDFWMCDGKIGDKGILILYIDIGPRFEKYINE